MSLNEDALTKLIYALSRASRPDQQRSRYELVAAVSELTAWLADERQSTRARPENWAWLLSDLTAAYEECGQHLAQVLTSTGLDVQAEVSAVRSAVKARNHPPDAALRRRLAHVADELSRLCRMPEARAAALEDALVAADAGGEEALAASHRLVALAAPAGRQPRSFGSGTADALSHSRGDSERSLEQRLIDAREYVTRGTEPTRIVIWLRIEYADVGWPPTIRLGPHVQLFNDKWLRDALGGAGNGLRDDAPEAHEDPDHLSHLIRQGESGHPGGEATPTAILRVSFDDEYVARARQRALQTADALAGLACLYGAHPGTWIVADEYCSYVQDGHGGTTVSADEDRRIPAFPALALQGDQAAQSIAEVSEDLGRHLPIAEDDVAEAGRLLHWLRQARLSSSPPRVLLNDRILEQVSGWAGFDDMHHFVRDYLRVEWAHSRLYRDVLSAATGAHYILFRERHHLELLAEYCEHADDPQTTINLPSFLAVVERVRAAVERTDSVWRRENPLAVSKLQRVAAAARSASVRKRWLTAVQHEFDRLEQRRRRTRNGLMHGGPLAETTVESVIDFAEQLAATSLGASIEGRLLKRRELIDHFLLERRRHELMARRVRAGVGLANALFSEV